MKSHDRQTLFTWLLATVLCAALGTMQPVFGDGSDEPVASGSDPAALRAAALDTLATLVLAPEPVESGDPIGEELRNDAVELIGQYGGVEHTAVLLQRLETAPSNQAKVIVIHALGELHDRTVLPTLRDLFTAAEIHRTGDDMHWSVSAAAGDALLRHGAEGRQYILEAARGQDAQARRRALQTLGRAGDPGRGRLAITLAKDRDRWVRLEAAQTLGSLTEPADRQNAITALKKLLIDIDPGVREIAAQSLARLGDSSGISHLERLLKSETESPEAASARARAARLLTRLDPVTSMPKLLALSDTIPADTDLDDIAALLSACDRATITPLLLEACDHKNATIRATAAALLGRLKEADALETLIALLNDLSWDVRAQAAEALGRLNKRMALPALRSLAEQLTRRGTDELTRSARAACALALVKLGDRDSAVPLCLFRLGDRVRVDVAPAVAAAVGGDEIERVLIDSVKKPDPGQPLERLLDELTTLELLQSRAGGLVLEELLREQPYTRQLALNVPEVWAGLLHALGASGAPPAATTAALYANHETPIVRLAACRAILQLTTRDSKGD